jgi:hypothetical protein
LPHTLGYRLFFYYEAKRVTKQGLPSLRDHRDTQRLPAIFYDGVGANCINISLFSTHGLPESHGTKGLYDAHKRRRSPSIFYNIVQKAANHSDSPFCEKQFQLLDTQHESLIVRLFKSYWVKFVSVSF